jgi:hypothetical protein
MSTTATHPMQTKGRKEWLLSHVMQLAGVAFIATALVLIAIIGDPSSPTSTAEAVGNAALALMAASVIAQAFALVLERRAWHWTRRGIERAPEPAWLYWGSLALRLAVLIGAVIVMVAVLPATAVLSLIGAVFYVAAGVSAVNVGVQRGRARANAIVAFVVFASSGAFLVASGPADLRATGGTVAALVLVGALLCAGIRMVARTLRS